MEGPAITRAGDVALPVRVVELAHLKTTAGEPVRVGCNPVDAVRIAMLVGLPGYRPPAIASEGANAGATDSVSRIEEFLESAPAIIESGTFLLDAEGREVRPAFFFGDQPPHPLAIPARNLFFDDLVLLSTTILELGGLIGGAATDEKFPAVDADGGARRPGGAGAVAVLPRDGSGAPDGASGP